MAPLSEAPQHSSYAKSILLRFAHLLSAQGVDGVLSTLFFLYLAWLNKEFYGEVMLAQAAGAILVNVVQFGLYYPQVGDLSRADDREKAAIVNRVTIIKVGLLTISALTLWAVTAYQGYSTSMAWIVLMIALGNGAEAVADSFFADLRVRGLQQIEARMKIGASGAAYGYGLVTAAMGLPPVVVALFKLVSGLIRVLFGFGWYLRAYSSRLSLLPDDWSAIYGILGKAFIFALIQILGTVYNKLNFFFLERAAGREGVALYSSTYNLVDPVSTLASEQLLAWVVFPVLAILWWKKKEQVAPLVRNTALWLIMIALPIVFALHTESDLLIRLIYPSEYSGAASLQRYLVWSIPLSFESNLFQYVMVVAGAARMLLLFQGLTTVMNLVYNVLLVQPFGPLGGCLVLVFTKLTMTVFAFTYCQVRYRYFSARDFLFPCTLALAGLGFYVSVRPVVGLHVGVGLTLAMYLGLLWRFGMKFLGDFPRKSEEEPTKQDTSSPGGPPEQSRGNHSEPGAVRES